MNKKLVAIIVAVVAVLAIGGGAWALMQNQTSSTTSDDAMMKNETTSDDAVKDDESMEKDGAMTDEAAMSEHGSYVTLADYNGNKSKYADSTKVYFFHAPWCPVCKEFDEKITADAGLVPTGVTIIKTDFDSETDLRQKYGVTYQHTFVQVDDSGELVDKWTESDLDTALAKIKV